MNTPNTSSEDRMAPSVMANVSAISRQFTDPTASAGIRRKMVLK